VTQAPPVHDSRMSGAAVTPGEAVEHRRELHDLYRRMVLHEETAAMLESRAARSDNPVLAGVLRERAADHLGRADQARAYLVADGVVAPVVLDVVRPDSPGRTT
jgi:hypothetical protein